MMYRYLQYALLAGLFSHCVAVLKRRARQESVAKDQSELQISKLAGTTAPYLAAKFFDEFSEGESTYDEAFFHRSPDFDQVGYDEDIPQQAVDAEIFAETPSAGSKEAWQTYWPGSAKVQTNRIGPKPTWHRSNDGYDEPYLAAKSNRDGTDGSGFKAARWFDSSVLKYNGMGQPQLPAKGTGARLQEADAMDNPWVQRAVNTSLLCKEAGCTATSKMTVFNTTTEEVERCRLNIEVHPTDYDNQWGQEFVKIWKVNGHMATAKCLPNAMGCNDSAWRPLIPCLQDLSVDHVLETGSLLIEGSINKLVDECPYQGFLLNAVATVTCMARPKMKAPLFLAPHAQYGGAVQGARSGAFDVLGAGLGYGPNSPFGPDFWGSKNGPGPNGAHGPNGAYGTYGAFGPYGLFGPYGNGLNGLSGPSAALGPFGYLYESLGYGIRSTNSFWGHNMNASDIRRILHDRLDPNMSFLMHAPLRCCAPGCAARGVLEVDPVILRAGAHCFLNFSVVQTDYDESVGNDVERIEFISVSGLGNVSKNMKPGRNPCTEEYSTGKSVPTAERVVTVLENQDVTEQLRAPPFGQLIIDGKITEQVDDCAFEDALFHGMAVVQCRLPSFVQTNSTTNSTANSSVNSTEKSGTKTITNATVNSTEESLKTNATLNSTAVSKTNETSNATTNATTNVTTNATTNVTTNTTSNETSNETNRSRTTHVSI